ncbi:MAG TPA: carbohydrate-binding protein, partial [Opitutaceae bacterium]|nr:carbohydrate-binding protein [Opitutaceae bacterium]
GGSELTVGSNYAFRISDTTLNYWGAFVDTSANGGVGTVSVCNFSTGGLPQAAAPVFSPAAGTYTNTQNVSITSTTGGASIRYTTDNSTPSETAGTLYSGPVNIATTTTLKGIAFETGFTDSNITTGLYTITAASFTITASAGSGGSISPSGSVGVTQGANQSFTITPSSGFNVSSVTVDGANQGAITSYTFSNVQANHTISAAFQQQSSGEGPFGGTAAAIPGTVQAENYDTGGQGVAYNVTSVNGTDNGYRSDGVDLEVCSDTGGGVDLGWESPGQWFKYTVNVATAGTYTVSFRVAAPNAVTDAFHLSNASGTNLSGNVNVPATGGYQTWATVTANVTLPAGQQILTLNQDTGGGIWNINYASFAQQTPTFTITASAGSGGSISPSGGVVVNQGANKSFTITPNSGFNVSSVTVDGANQGAITSYTFSNVQANHTISAAFQQQSTEGPFGGTPAAIPGTVQAENYDTGGQGVAYNVGSINGTDNGYRSDGVDLEVTSDTGGGVDLGWTFGGDWFKYTVNVATAGTYTVSFRIAAPTAVTDGLHLSNSSGTNLSGNVNIPATGGYQTWATVTANVTLPAGQQILTLNQDNGGWNINYLGFAPANSAPNFGPNVIIFDPSMSSSSIQTQINNIYNQQSSSTSGQFDSSRYALVFKPGTYNNTVNVGYYTQVLGLGQSPDNVTINGGIISNAALSGNNATCNFWEGAENLSVVPAGGTDQWAVSQACPMRRVHIKGSIVLDQSGGYSSGGFLSDSLIDNQINSGSQQQWISRNSQWGSWAGSNWNMVFVGDTNAPSGANWPNPAYTVTSQTPVVREKPFLTIDGSGNYSVFVPALSTNSSGITWSSGSSAGQSIPISQFYIAHSSSDTAATLNAALSQGKNLLLTPGIYSINSTLQVNNPNTVVLGLGLATLLSQNGVTTMTVADVDGVTISGILFDAGSTNSAYQLQVGPTGSSASHASNPTVLHDLFFRVGGAAVGKTTVSLQINSNNVIGDDFWIWRADHGNSGTVGWTTNTATNGIVVNGANVTIYGLAVEHYQQYQTLWNGNGGSVYFYQSEAPYDPPNQSSWMAGSEDGYASYKVANTVTSHQAYGVGVYCFFNVNSSVILGNAIEVPTSGLNGAMIHNMTTVSLGGVGTIASVIDGYGATANSSNNVVHLIK